MVRLSTAEVKTAARGRWPEILAAVGGIDGELLDGKGHPCPKCGGKDRFSVLDLDRGALHCRKCFAKRNGDGLAALCWLTGKPFADVLRSVAEFLGIGGKPSHGQKPQAARKAKPGPGAAGKPRVVAGYDYRDEDGDLLYQVLRLEPGKNGRKKDFRQRRPQAGGKWIWETRGVRRVPYRLPELLAAHHDTVVHVVEGEGKVEALRSLGLVATCCDGGAGKWRPDFAPYFLNRHVVILPDNDTPGEKHALQVADNLHTTAACVRIIFLPGLAAKHDVVDWLRAGHDKDELLALVEAAPEWTPAEPADDGAPSVVEVEAHAPSAAPFVPFPTEALPTVPRDFIRAAADALGCDESYVALPTLAALASCVGNTRRIRLKRTWCEPCVVWAAVVGESGTLKSPAHDLALAPLHALQRAAFSTYKKDSEQYAQQKAVYEADMLEWKRTARKAGAPPPAEPAEPVPVRYLCADTTVEALAVLLEAQGRGLLMARDELSGWVNSFDAYKACRGADVPHWLSMHRAGPLTVDRKTGRKVIHVPRAAVSIAGNVQPRALAAALVGRFAQRDGEEGVARPPREHFDNGLAARLLFTMPPAKPKRWTEADLPAAIELAMHRLCEALLALDFAHDDEGEAIPIDVPLSIRGKAAWVSFYNAHAAELNSLHGDLAAAWCKLEGYAARFALLVHLVRVAISDATLQDKNQVDNNSILSGVLLSHWFGDEASRVYSVIGGDLETPEAREDRHVLRIMAARGGQLTVRDLMQASRSYRETADQAEKVLRRLVKRGLVLQHLDDHGGGRGRPVAVFRLTHGGNGNTNSETADKRPNALPGARPDGEPLAEWRL